VSSQSVADLEARVRANPEDVESRITLLRLYDSTSISPGNDPGRRLARLDHIVYLIDHHPEMSAMGTQVAYVSSARSGYANRDDHQVAWRHWLSAVDSHL